MRNEKHPWIRFPIQPHIWLSSPARLAFLSPLSGAGLQHD